MCKCVKCVKCVNSYILHIFYLQFNCTSVSPMTHVIKGKGDNIGQQFWHRWKSICLSHKTTLIRIQSHSILCSFCSLLINTTNLIYKRVCMLENSVQFESNKLFSYNHTDITWAVTTMFLKWDIPSLFRLFSDFFKQTIRILQQINVKSSIQYMVLGFELTILMT